jgi:hypothetical protein
MNDQGRIAARHVRRPAPRPTAPEPPPEEEDEMVLAGPLFRANRSTEQISP